MWRAVGGLFMSLLLAATVRPVVAQETGNAPFGISEFRAGVLAHSIDDVGPNGEMLNFTRPVDLSFEILFRSPQIDAFYWIGSPRPVLGANLNTGGLESFVRLGLNWHVPLFDSPFYVEGTFGGMVHNGALTSATYPARPLGCSLLFYESAGVGANVADNMTVTAFLEHSSSANICNPNRGLTNAGVKVGIRF